jgi:hypothetical protein
MLDMSDQVQFILPKIKDYEQSLVLPFIRDEQELKDLNVDDYINQLAKGILAKLDECRVSLKVKQEEVLKALEVGSSEGVNSAENSTNANTGNLDTGIIASQSNTPY